MALQCGTPSTLIQCTWPSPVSAPHTIPFHITIRMGFLTFNKITVYTPSVAYYINWPFHSFLTLSGLLGGEDPITNRYLIFAQLTPSIFVNIPSTTYLKMQTNTWAKFWSQLLCGFTAVAGWNAEQSSRKTPQFTVQCIKGGCSTVDIESRWSNFAFFSHKTVLTYLVS